MLPEVISHNPCLKRLQDEGFKIEARGGRLFVYHLPYLNSKGTVCDGTLMMPLPQNGLTVSINNDHKAYWIGEEPFGLNGKPLYFINPGVPRQALENGEFTNYSFSRMPDKGMYPDFYAKVTAYADSICTPAERVDKLACLRIKESPMQSEYVEDSIFQYPDTNSSRAGITGFNDVFKGMKIGIIGVGGTGSYVLDKVAKTEVSEIHLYDDDILCNHNAFRAPGAISADILESKPLKVDYFTSEYSKMRQGLIPHPEKISTKNVCLLDDIDFAFICVDSKEAREQISAALIERGIPFIDSGVGAIISNGHIMGVIRTTISFGEKIRHLKHEFNSDGASDDIYSSNIQISEINSFAADMAVIRWKRLVGYYADRSFDLNSVYSINTNLIINTKDEPNTESETCLLR